MREEEEEGEDGSHSFTNWERIESNIPISSGNVLLVRA